MQEGVADHSVDDFYYLSRATLVKDERNLDRFDRVFGHVFRGLEAAEDGSAAEIPEEWLRKLAELYLSEEEKAQVQALGGWEQLMETLRQRLAAPRGRHQGGRSDERSEVKECVRTCRSRWFVDHLKKKN